MNMQRVKRTYKRSPINLCTPCKRRGLHGQPGVARWQQRGGRRPLAGRVLVCGIYVDTTYYTVVVPVLLALPKGTRWTAVGQAANPFEQCALLI